MGILWSFFNPLFMLAVYTFVFSVVFKARWNAQSESKTEFAMVLFSGLIVFNLFSECIGRAPTLITQNSNYVKKVIFPLEILPCISLGSALFHATVSLGVWVLFYLTVAGIPHVTLLALPAVLLPLFLLILGLSWLLSSLGAFLRDLSQIVTLLLSVLMFVSPVFYPISAIPEQYRFILRLNPLTHTIEEVRALLLQGQLPNFLSLSMQFVIYGIFAWVCFAWFQKTRKAFADVV